MSIDSSNQFFEFSVEPERKLRVSGKLEAVTQARNILDAAHLVRLGARAALVSQLTGVTRNVVNGLYPSITGMSSPSGQVPFTDAWYLRSSRRMLHANVVWRLFRNFGQIDRNAASVLIHVYEAYLDIVDAPLLSLTRVFFVPRLLTIEMWYERTCEHCRMSYIGPLDNGSAMCPACIEYFRYRCRGCGVSIDYQPVGRWKTFCSGCGESQKRRAKHPINSAVNGHPSY